MITLHSRDFGNTSEQQFKAGIRLCPDEAVEAQSAAIRDIELYTLGDAPLALGQNDAAGRGDLSRMITRHRQGLNPAIFFEHLYIVMHG